jgi:hypothetical protein
MLDRFERPVKIVCLALALLLAWQLGSLILSGDPLANLRIPPLPTLPGATNELANPVAKETNATPVKKTGTNAPNGTNAALGTNAVHDTNAVRGTNAVGLTNAVGITNAVGGTNLVAALTNASRAGDPGRTNAASGPGDRGSPRAGAPGAMPVLPPGMTPDMMAGGMMGGGRAGVPKKIELPPEAKARVERIIDSEVFGPVMRPVPMALIGISEDEAFIRATNGQTGSVKVGGQFSGIKLLRVGVNRVLVEQDGDQKELTLFGGVGGESLMPKPSGAPSINMPSTNSPSTNPPAAMASARNAAARNPSTNQTLSSKQKETQ